MKILMGILGSILLLPIALVLVVLIVISLIGGYITAVVMYFWYAIAIIVGIILLVKFIKWIF